VAKIKATLIEQLHKKLSLRKSRIYELIEQKVREVHLPRHLAAIAVASEAGINISKFVTDDDLANIRQATRVASQSTVLPSDIAVSQNKRIANTSKRSNRKPVQRRRDNTVFVVHGRNEEARKAFFMFLRALGLKPIEWNQAIKKTRQASPYVGTILERAFSEAASIVVLFTPDDEARLKKRYQRPRDSNYETNLTGQARPNVLFEAGMAYGKNPNSTVLVQLGDVRPFSDVAGRHIVHLSNDFNSRQELAIKLSNAGCEVDTSGSDWLTVGDFDRI
jgi:predicted nucleotide-binding protein